MGVTLFDQQSNAIIFDTNFWNWRAIVEAVRSLGVLPDERIEALHEPWVGELTGEEARAVALALANELLPRVGERERLLLDGTRTTEPDDGTLYRDPAEQHRNYSTNRLVLEEFARCCKDCNGFRVS